MISEVTQTGRIVQIRAKTLDVNAYIIHYPEYLIVIDSLLLPGDSQKLADLAESYNKPVKYQINTHFHSDHCLGNRYLKKQNTTQINQKDYWDTIISERAMIKPRRNKPINHGRLTKPEITFTDEYILDDIILLSTPGHSPDSICLYLPSEKALISGDTILNNAVGKYSLPYFFWGSAQDLIVSMEKLLALDINIIYSGHGFPLQGTAKIHSDLTYLRNLTAEVNKHKSQQLTSKQLAEQIPISSCLNSSLQPAVPQVHELNIRQLKSEH
ncbi:MAG: MBL fold metallo-hydrolase [Candidatus Stygibacter australis]|nr:MBL fold metallo-hydrolase [Candidatus Stygibacter australis]MDP8323395.1 MBL fold metallo-hydrolase [Candidatus Stygibacter australis]